MRPYSKSKLELNSKKVELTDAEKFRLCLYIFFFPLKGVLNSNFRPFSFELKKKIDISK